MRLRTLFSVFFATILTTNIAFGATSSWQENQSGAAQTRLIASFYEKDGVKKLIAGLHFKIKSGWKIYGNDQSGIGLPPNFDFSGSKNYLSHEISWPDAQNEEEKIGNETVKYSIYKNEIIIPLEISLEKNDQPTELNLRLNYGLCKDICIPANESFSLQISDEIDEEVLKEIQKYTKTEILKQAQDDAQNKTTDRLPLTAYHLLHLVLIAFIGGAILNIMPCVLPVLSIKLLSIVDHSGAAISRIRFAFFSTIIGILSCFVLFAFLASAIKITGNSLGWGLQFQNPYFLIFLILVLTFFTANLIGIFEISFNQILATILDKKISQSEKNKNIFIPNFLSGVLAVLLATPCSAPFLGSAISFALVKDFSVIFTIFLAIGIGFASPYFILIASPKLVKKLPKPGIWMTKTKQVMAGFLVATIIWLAYVLSNNIGTLPAFLIALFSVTIFGCLKIKSDLLRYLTLLVIIISSFALPADLEKYHQRKKSDVAMLWRNFDEAELYSLVAQGKTVLVDVTADWCITCKFNKLRVLSSEEIVVRLKRGDIIGMRGDITKPNEEIMNFLHKHNRFAIPFNAVYGPNAKMGLLTSELPTEKEVLELIKQAN